LPSPRGAAPKTWAFAEIDEILKEKERRLDSHWAITMAGGNDALVKGYEDQINEERIERLEAVMLSRLDSIGRIVVDREGCREADTDASPAPPFLAPFVPLLDALTPHLIRLGRRVESSFDFYYDQTCTGCGVCESVCLAGKVRMVHDRPVWSDSIRCHGCFACLSFCPKQSIQVKSKWYLRSYTEQNGRYHHPEITANDIASQKTQAREPLR